MTGKLLAYHLKSPRVPLVVRVPQFENHCCIWTNTYQLINGLTSNYETTAEFWRTTSSDSYLIRLVKRQKFAYHVQNDVTIRLNRSTERKNKRTNNERTMVTEQNPHLLPHNISWKFQRADLAVTRFNLQLQCYQNC